MSSRNKIDGDPYSAPTSQSDHDGAAADQFDRRRNVLWQIARGSRRGAQLGAWCGLIIGLLVLVVGVRNTVRIEYPLGVVERVGVFMLACVVLGTAIGWLLAGIWKFVRVCRGNPVRPREVERRRA
jgi:uncharacterized integral membrane protein